jgi:predicted dithiol-disulfide oxidoreductase (DUF899 family)
MHRVDTDEGPAIFAGLSRECSQLLEYHSVVGPGYQEGCPVCVTSADTTGRTFP